VTITLVYPKKIKELFMQAYSRRDPQAVAKYQEITRPLRNTSTLMENLSIFQKYPEYFKTVTINGREKLFRYLTTDLKMPQNQFEKFFGVFSGELSNEHTERFHNAILIFPESMRESRRKTLLSVLERTYQHLEHAGMARVFGGKIRCITKSGAAGVYIPATQTMSVTPIDANEDSMVATLIHEYAHKFWYEIMTPAQRDAVRTKYKELYNERIRALVNFDRVAAQKKSDIAASVNTDLLKLGTIVVYAGKSSKAAKRGERFVVNKVFPREICIARESDPNRTVFYGKPESFLYNSRWEVEGNGKVEKQVAMGGDYNLESDAWFPTKYSTTDEEEWWADCFMLFILGHLHGEPEKWFAKIIQ
jgi:hypothetical protein